MDDRKVSNVAAVIIVFVLSLCIVPSRFKDTEYFDNVYYLIELLMLAFISISAPLYLLKNNGIGSRLLAVVSFCLFFWFSLGAIYELANFWQPHKYLNGLTNAFEDGSLFNYAHIVFRTVLVFWTANEIYKIWKSKRSSN